jgi:hypothetical protein
MYLAERKINDRTRGERKDGSRQLKSWIYRVEVDTKGGS